MPHTEPNSLPSEFSEWYEWREAYAGRVSTFNASPKGSSDFLYLRVQLGKLGFVGTALDLELKYIKEGGT